MIKNIDYYLALPYKLVIIPDPSNNTYVGAYPDLPGCLTIGNTLEEAAKNAKDAKLCWLEAALEDGVNIAEPDMEKTIAEISYNKEKEPA